MKEINQTFLELTSREIQRRHSSYHNLTWRRKIINHVELNVSVSLADCLMSTYTYMAIPDGYRRLSTHGIVHRTDKEKKH